MQSFPNQIVRLPAAIIRLAFKRRFRELVRREGVSVQLRQAAEVADV
jgi:hypothetical protein